MYCIIKVKMYEGESELFDSHLYRPKNVSYGILGSSLMARYVVMTILLNAYHSKCLVHFTFCI